MADYRQLDGKYRLSIVGAMCALVTPPPVSNTVPAGAAAAAQRQTILPLGAMYGVKDTVPLCMS